MKLEEIEKLCEGASQGPWKLGQTDCMGYHMDYGVDHYDGATIIVHCEENNADNMEFIAASRELIPKLLKVAKAAKLYKNHSCGLDTWSNNCRLCNEFKQALDGLEE